MKKITTVFLDLDGVLVDCLKGLREAAGEPESFFDPFRKDPSTCSHSGADALFGEGRLAQIQQERSVEWWVDLEIFPWTNYLINTISANYPVCFLTSPGICVNAGTGKLKWQQKFYPNIPILIGRDKFRAASETKVLIDDEKGQLNRFEEAGGLAIQWPNQFYLERMTKNTDIEELIADMLRIMRQHENRINNS